jgi:DNA-binding MarR family transcriptional regulator
MPRSQAERQHTVKNNSPQRTPTGTALSQLVVEILRIHGLVIAAGDALAIPYGQSAARWQVLASIEEQPLSVANIARVLNLARQSVQRVADVLVADRLAEYDINPAHARAKLHSLTEQGRATLRGIQHAQVIWANAVAAKLKSRELQATTAALGNLREILVIVQRQLETAAHRSERSRMTTRSPG